MARFAYLLLLWPLLGVADLSPAQQQRYEQIIHQTRCVTCQNQSIADSYANVAKAMRESIYEQVEQGQSDEQIQLYLLERYGDYVSYKPALKPSTWMLWLTPFLLFILAVGFFAKMTRGQRR